MTELRARDVMAKELVVLSPDLDVHRAMQVLLDSHVSGAPVVDERGNLVGILTQRDCLTVAFHAGYHREPAGNVADYMITELETIPADMALIDVIETFVRSRYRRFPVLDGNQLVGQISRRDILRAVVELW